MKLPVSILVMTKNEEKNLPGCLDSVAWSDDIHIFDSFSNDLTVEIGKRFGATITQRKFDNWSAHQNWGLSNIPFKNNWVFYIDADERMTSSLVLAIRDIVENLDSEIIAYQVQRRDYFMQRWLKHVQTTPYYIRFFCPDKIHYERLVNPVTVVDGKVGRLGGFLDHYPFSKGVTHWLDRHNSYSSFEAQQIYDNQLKNESFSLSKAFFSNDYQTRRFHQKEIFYKLPARPLAKFFILYFLKLGFLDGRAGLTYALLQMIYEYMIILKFNEISSNTF
ncbi:glycosyltransferase family 2 protein [Acaryochloris marina NIES-2412]|uniref:glycosyltransferase family 2 protein n=1 Tax=Acaryochloris marina TaxID=155978 RepID=UPI004059A95A